MGNERFVFIVNPQSGRGKGLEYSKGIEEWFRLRGTDPVIAFTTKDGPDSAFALGKRAAESGVGTLVVVAGDGTKHLVVNGMMASGVSLKKLPTLGFIQAGVGNDFAKNVGTPEGFDEAMKVIVDGKTALVDLGILTTKNEKRYFLNVVSFGFDAVVTEMAKGLKEKYRLIPRAATYGLAAVKKIILGFQSYPVKIAGQGFEVETEAILLAVMNGPIYGAIFRIAPAAVMSDGLFDVCLVDKISNDILGKMRAVEILARATKGKHVKLPEVKFFRVSSLTVSSQEALPCEADGEVLPAEKRYEISILPKTLKVLVSPPVLATQRLLVSKDEAPEFQFV